MRRDILRIARMSLIDESGERYVRMAHLACAGSHAINGVAELHSELLKSDVLRDFHELWPEKFSNKTNSVTPRRWVVLANPRLAECITQRIGDGWIRDLDLLRELEPLTEDADFRHEWRAIKLANKTDPHFDIEPRVLIFGGKAAPDYFLAELIIRLITAVAEIVNRDAGVRDLVKVLFLPNFSVTNGQRIYPAADLSEQVSLAGKEASGTGNMKFQMNRALTIGTLDGANIEIRDEVGAENFFLFGLSTPEVQALRVQGYDPRAVYESNAEIHEVIGRSEGRLVAVSLWCAVPFGAALM